MSVQHKRNSTTGVSPLPSELLEGELAINTSDEIIYTKNESGNIITLSGIKSDRVNTYSKGQNSLHETIPFATTLTLDGNAISNSIHIDATADFTLNIFSNILGGVIRGGVITVTQDATGGRVATFTGWTVSGNTATTVANTTAIYDYEFILGVGYIKLREVV